MLVTLRSTLCIEIFFNTSIVFKETKAEIGPLSEINISVQAKWHKIRFTRNFEHRF